MNDPIRILQVVTHMNRGGLESMLMNYYRNIDRNTIQFDFLTHRPENEKKDFDDEIKAMGGIIYHLPVMNPLSLEYRHALNTFFKEHPEYKIVHVHQDCMSSIVLKYAQKNGVPIRIAHSHNTMQDKNYKYYLKMHYKKQIPAYATDLFSCGREAGNWMFGGRRYKILNNAIDVDRYRFDETMRNEYRARLGVSDKFVIGHVGRFCAQKNHEYLIRIFSVIAESNRDTVLLLIGTGELQNRIKSLVDALGLETRVKFLGVRDDIPPILMAMDCFLFPSLYEGLPVTLMEAQASGLPCIISQTVTDEVMVTDLITRMDLKDSPDEWSRQIQGQKVPDRVAYADKVKAARYDIKSEANHLAQFYKDRVRGIHT